MFQFTRPRGARRNPHLGWIIAEKFQFTRPRGARLRRGRKHLPQAVVSIHAPARGATGIDAISKALVALFQFTRPRGARLAIKNNQIRAGWGFNSRAREGRDRAFFKMFAWMSLFQFTRPRGARLAADDRQDLAGEFQFTRPRGARRGRFSTRPPIKGFQFTRPRGARLLQMRYLNLWPFVSIHAPARGATHNPPLITSPKSGFNSRAREGRDTQSCRGSTHIQVSIHAPARGATKARAEWWASKKFQFTRPRGARPSRSACFRPRASFNSRAREGRDASLYASSLPITVSIHAPARGATWIRVCTPARTCRFNSRAREGRDMASSEKSFDVLRFQFTRPRGARLG